MQRSGCSSFDYSLVGYYGTSRMSLWSEKIRPSLLSLQYYLTDTLFSKHNINYPLSLNDQTPFSKEYILTLTNAFLRFCVFKTNFILLLPCKSKFYSPVDRFADTNE